MTDIEYLEKILHHNYRCNELVMVENAQGDKEEQRVPIKQMSDLGLALYRFADDVEGVCGLFPFFNPNLSGESHVENLFKFCDYILLAQRKGEDLYVFLLELKRGEAKEAEKQLAASQTFFDFVLNTADRVREANHCLEFAKGRVCYRRIVVKQARSNKQVTKPKDIDRSSLDKVMTWWGTSTTEFCPVHYL